MNVWTFDGDCSFLPLSAHIHFGEVPLYPVEGDFHRAVSDVEHDPENAAAHWRVEAVRVRLHNPGKPLDDLETEINARTVKRIYEFVTENC